MLTDKRAGGIKHPIPRGIVGLGQGYEGRHHKHINHAIKSDQRLAQGMALRIRRRFNRQHRMIAQEHALAGRQFYAIRIGGRSSINRYGHNTKLNYPQNKRTAAEQLQRDVGYYCRCQRKCPPGTGCAGRVNGVFICDVPGNRYITIICELVSRRFPWSNAPRHPIRQPPTPPRA